MHWVAFIPSYHFLCHTFWSYGCFVFLLRRNAKLWVSLKLSPDLVLLGNHSAFKKIPVSRKEKKSGTVKAKFPELLVWVFEYWIHYASYHTQCGPSESYSFANNCASASPRRTSFIPAAETRRKELTHSYSFSFFEKLIGQELECVGLKVQGRKAT